MTNINLDWSAWMAGETNLEKVRKALSREEDIRRVMAASNEPREIVAEMVDAQDSMGQEGVLNLMEGDVTTLRAALERYTESLWTEGGRPIAEDLRAILDYPYPGQFPDLEFVEAENRNLSIRFSDSREIIEINWEDAGSGGLQAVESAVKAVHIALKERS